MKENKRKPKRPEGYRKDKLQLTLTAKEKSLLSCVKEHYNKKYGTKISTADMIIMATMTFAKKEKFKVELEQKMMFQTHIDL